MHTDSQVRSQAQRCLNEGGPYIVISRTDRWSGSLMSDPTINNLAYFVSGHDDREGKALEEKLVRDAFAAFVTTYTAGLREIIGEGQPEAEAAPAPRSAPPLWPQATEVPDATPVSKPLASAEVV